MAKERVENLQDAKRAAQAPEEESDKRERSTIQFPYNDLDDAVGIAKAIHENAGIECTIDQLAAYLKVSMTSGAFRVRTANAATFGVTENERGVIRLTDIGRRIADTAQESAARAEAFLHVPLYALVFEHFKGYTLPGAAALEKFMRDAGVSSKQTDKARQAFMRSAKQAGFFAHGEDRLVRPAGPGTKPIEKPKGEPKKDDDKRRNGAGDGGGPTDALIQALIEKLPAQGPWSADERINWLKMLVMGFQVAYGADDEIEVKKKEAAN
jgi:hypothetical protein